jgi:hypothetical protein
MRNDLKLAAFCVQRRSIGAAIFVGTHLGFSDVRQLASDRDKAKAAAVGFVNWILETFDIDTSALEMFEGSQDFMKAGTYQEVEQVLRGRDISIQSIDTAAFLNSYAHPAKVSRKDVREIVSNIWPILDSDRSHPAKLDAVALGLYCQTHRLLQ